MKREEGKGDINDRDGRMKSDGSRRGINYYTTASKSAKEKKKRSE